MVFDDHFESARLLILPSAVADLLDSFVAPETFAEAILTFSIRIFFAFFVQLVWTAS